MTAILTRVAAGTEPPGASDATPVDGGTGGPPESTSAVVVVAATVVAVVAAGASDATRAVVDGPSPRDGDEADVTGDDAAGDDAAPNVGVVTGSALPNITYTTPTVTMQTAINGKALRRARRS